MTVNIPADKICQGGRRRFWMKAYLKVLAQCISQQQLKSTHFCMGTWPDLKLPESELKSGVCVCVCVFMCVCGWALLSDRSVEQCTVTQEKDYQCYYCEDGSLYSCPSSTHDNAGSVSENKHTLLPIQPEQLKLRGSHERAPVHHTGTVRGTLTDRCHTASLLVLTLITWDPQGLDASAFVLYSTHSGSVIIHSLTFTLSHN